MIERTKFMAAASVTREKFIVMFYYCARNLGVYDMSQRADITRASDYAMLSGETVDQISWAVASGIIRGTSANRLTIPPEAVVNRATVCQMIMNYFGGI